MGEPHQRASGYATTCPAPRDTVPSRPAPTTAPSARSDGGNDPVRSPRHYTRLSPEPLDVIEAWRLNFHEGSAVKYIARWRHKGGTEDLRKAAQVLLRLADLEDHGGG